MKGFDAKFIDELKRKNDIVDIVGKYVRLEQRGGNFWGKCPFHHEKTASFSVNSSNQFFYCFGCHKSGDVISFTMEIESLDFNDAVKFLAERVKMPLPEVRYDDEKIREQKKQKERILDLLKDSARFYAMNLRSEGAEKHLEYILKRKIPSECVAKFGIGASLNFNGLVNHLKEKGYTYEEMTLSGAVDVKDGRYYDSLGGRLIIPVHDELIVEVPFEHREKGAEILKRSMEGAGSFLPFPISCDIEMTFRWYGLEVDDILSFDEPTAIDYDTMSESNIMWLQSRLFEQGYVMPVFKNEDGSKPIGIAAKGINGKVSDDLKSAVEDYKRKYHLDSDDVFIHHLDKLVTTGKVDLNI